MAPHFAIRSRRRNAPGRVIAAAARQAREALAHPLRAPAGRLQHRRLRRELAAAAIELPQAAAALRAHLVALARQRGRLRELLP